MQHFVKKLTILNYVKTNQNPTHPPKQGIKSKNAKLVVRENRISGVGLEKLSLYLYGINTINPLHLVHLVLPDIDLKSYNSTQF